MLLLKTPAFAVRNLGSKDVSRKSASLPCKVYNHIDWKLNRATFFPSHGSIHVVFVIHFTNLLFFAFFIFTCILLTTLSLCNLGVTVKASDLVAVMEISLDWSLYYENLIMIIMNILTQFWFHINVNIDMYYSSYCTFTPILWTTFD